MRFNFITLSRWEDNLLDNVKANYILKSKESEKLEKYQDLWKDLRKLWNRIGPIIVGIETKIENSRVKTILIKVILSLQGYWKRCWQIEYTCYLLV